MGWGDELAFRDCPWCGLRDAQMSILSTGLQTTPPGQPQRFWATLACPRCGGVVTLETNGPNQSPPSVMQVIPTDEQTVAQVRYLPSDVQSFYANARRVLDAGVPDAAAVELRKTLEAAAAHFGIKNGRLVDMIKKLIDEGLVTTQFGKVLDRIRTVGNVGAHASDVTVDQETAEQAYRFTTQVLRNLFEIPGELEVVDIGQELRATE